MWRVALCRRAPKSQGCAFCKAATLRTWGRHEIGRVRVQRGAARKWKGVVVLLFPVLRAIAENRRVECKAPRRGPHWIAVARSSERPGCRSAVQLRVRGGAYVGGTRVFVLALRGGSGHTLALHGRFPPLSLSQRRGRPFSPPQHLQSGGSSADQEWLKERTRHIWKSAQIHVRAP